MTENNENTKNFDDLSIISQIIGTGLFFGAFFHLFRLIMAENNEWISVFVLLVASAIFFVGGLIAERLSILIDKQN